MKINDYSVYKRFTRIEKAKEVQTLLNDAGIETRITDNLGPVDSNIIGGSDFLNKIEISIKQKYFKKADLLLKEAEEISIDEVDPDYYLLKFTDKELYEILLKPDEWGNIDYSLSKQLLKRRGKSIDDEMLEALKEQRIADLAKPDENQKAWIIAGYVLSVLGGFLGIVIGYLLLTSKKTLPNGKRVYSHKEKDRNHGVYILLLGIFVVLLEIIIRIKLLN